jgi:hypothetical protein
MIATTGLGSAHNETHYPDHIVNMITSYLPSNLPFNSDGFQSLANVLLEKRRKQSLEEKASSELTPCLICRGIEMVLQRSEETDASRTNASSGNTAHSMMTNNKPAANSTKSGVKRSRSADDTV